MILQEYFQEFIFPLNTSTKKHRLWIATDWAEMLWLKLQKISLKLQTVREAKLKAWPWDKPQHGWCRWERLRKGQAACQRAGNTQELGEALKTERSHGAGMNLDSTRCCEWNGCLTLQRYLRQHEESLKCHPSLYVTWAEDTVCCWPIKALIKFVSTAANHFEKKKKKNSAGEYQDIVLQYSGNKIMHFCSAISVLLLTWFERSSN